MGWNGLDLQTEFSELLCDTSTDFKSRVSSWIRDVEEDICANHTWPFLQVRGEKYVAALGEEQNLTITPPSPPTATLAAGGSLVNASTYNVKITFYEGISKIESEASSATSTLTATGVNRTINLTAIPVSTDPLVTKRKVYVSKDSGIYYYHGEIADNTTTTYSITTDTTSTIQLCEISYFQRLMGDLFIETSGQLKASSLQQIRTNFSGDLTATVGTPTIYAMLSESRVVLYNSPSVGTILSFYYTKNPRGIYPSVDSIPTIPGYLKHALELGVEWKGLKYRKNEGETNAYNMYQKTLQDLISRQGNPSKKSYTVRDVLGDSDGFTI